MVSQKCQYAVRAVFELAKRYGGRPVKIAEIAQAQAIPGRFLEIILSQLKQTGFIESRRGMEGGYLLSRPPAEISVGDVIRFVEGPLYPVGCMGDGAEKCALKEACVFMPMWRRVERAVAQIYEKTSFQDLIEEERRMQSGGYVDSYSI